MFQFCFADNKTINLAITTGRGFCVREEIGLAMWRLWAFGAFLKLEVNNFLALINTLTPDYLP